VLGGDAKHASSAGSGFLLEDVSVHPTPGAFIQRKLS